MRLALCLLALPLAVLAEDKPLPLVLPKSVALGTPKPMKIDNLEPPAKGPRVLPKVPAEAKNLALGCPVTSSAKEAAAGDFSFLTDGDKSGTDGTYVELGPTPQWVQIDLGASAKVAAIAVWHFHSQARVYHDVVVQVSNDKDFKTGVTTVYNNDDDNSSKLGKGKDLAYIENFEGRLFEAKGAAGRYVRLYSNGNTYDELNHYCEVEVHGSVAK